MRNWVCLSISCPYRNPEPNVKSELRLSKSNYSPLLRIIPHGDYPFINPNQGDLIPIPNLQRLGFGCSWWCGGCLWLWWWVLHLMVLCRNTFFFWVNEDSIRTKKQDTNQRGIPQIKTWST